MIKTTNTQMMNIIKDKDSFVKGYYDEFIRRYPFMNLAQQLALYKLVEESYEDTEVEFFNTYECSDKVMKSSDFLLEVYRDRLIVIENGMFFKPLTTKSELSPILEVEEFLANTRDVMKNKMRHYADVDKGNDPFQAIWFDNGQNSCKTDMNTLYGLNQTKTARVYNVDLATSITCRGRSVVSVTALCLEGILGGYFPRSLEGLVCIIADIENKIQHTMLVDYNIYKEICTIDVDVDMVMNHLKVTTDTPYYTIIKSILDTKHKDVLSFLYVTNNLREFLKIPTVSNEFNGLFEHVINSGKPFINPYSKDEKIVSVTANIKKYIYIINNSSWYQNDEDYKTCVKFINTQETIKGITRIVIGLIDTDSNMVAMYETLLTFYEMFHNDIMKERFSDKDNDFTFINAGTIIVEVAVRDILETYTDLVHVPDVHKPKVAFKNEYLYSMFLLTSRMKNYVGLCDIKEGLVYKKPKMDVKGLMYTKSSVNEVIGDIVGDIVMEDIIQPDDININALLSKITTTYETLKAEMLSKNAYEYFVSEKINDRLIDVPDSISRTKSVELYNVLDLYDRIVAPSKFLTIHIDFNKLDMDDISDDDMELVNRCICYTLIHNIHKNLKKIQDNEPIEMFNNRLQYIKKEYEFDINTVFDNGVNMMNEYLNGKLDTGYYDLKIFENGYAKNKEGTITRDDMFFMLLDKEGGDVTSLMTKLECTENVLKTYYKELSDIFKNTFSTEELEVFGKNYFSYSVTGLYDLNKISIPDALAENIPSFISKLNNVLKDAIQIENLLSPVIEACNIVTVKNDADKTNITNILNYF